MSSLAPRRPPGQHIIYEQGKEGGTGNGGRGETHAEPEKGQDLPNGGAHSAVVDVAGNTTGVKGNDL